MDDDDDGWRTDDGMDDGMDGWMDIYLTDDRRRDDGMIYRMTWTLIYRRIHLFPFIPNSAGFTLFCPAHEPISILRLCLVLCPFLPLLTTWFDDLVATWVTTILSLGFYFICHNFIGLGSYSYSILMHFILDDARILSTTFFILALWHEWTTTILF
jgi:hypothetical protein